MQGVSLSPSSNSLGLWVKKNYNWLFLTSLVAATGIGLAVGYTCGITAGVISGSGSELVCLLIIAYCSKKNNTLKPPARDKKPAGSSEGTTPSQQPLRTKVDASPSTVEKTQETDGDWVRINEGGGIFWKNERTGAAVDEPFPGWKPSSDTWVEFLAGDKTRWINQRSRQTREDRPPYGKIIKAPQPGSLPPATTRPPAPTLEPSRPGPSSAFPTATAAATSGTHLPSTTRTALSPDPNQTWVEFWDKNTNSSYYWNPETREKTRDIPPHFKQDRFVSTRERVGFWFEIYDRDRNVYLWRNAKTNTWAANPPSPDSSLAPLTSHPMPPPSSASQVAGFPAAPSHVHAIHSPAPTPSSHPAHHQPYTPAVASSLPYYSGPPADPRTTPMAAAFLATLPQHSPVDSRYPMTAAFVASEESRRLAASAQLTSLPAPQPAPTPPQTPGQTPLPPPLWAPVVSSLSSVPASISIPSSFKTYPLPRAVTVAEPMPKYPKENLTSPWWVHPVIYGEEEFNLDMLKRNYYFDESGQLHKFPQGINDGTSPWIFYLNPRNSAEYYWINTHTLEYSWDIPPELSGKVTFTPVPVEKRTPEICLTSPFYYLWANNRGQLFGIPPDVEGHAESRYPPTKGPRQAPKRAAPALAQPAPSTSTSPAKISPETPAPAKVAISLDSPTHLAPMPAAASASSSSASSAPAKAAPQKISPERLATLSPISDPMNPDSPWVAIKCFHGQPEWFTLALSYRLNAKGEMIPSVFVPSAVTFLWAWYVHPDNPKLAFWFNTSTGESSWTCPVTPHQFDPRLLPQPPSPVPDKAPLELHPFKPFHYAWYNQSTGKLQQSPPDGWYKKPPTQ